jgi:methylenetetrahydrofolate reductase (NADPH)
MPAEVPLPVMARIDQILEETHPSFSFEFFPPKTEEGEKNLRVALQELKKDNPSYVSVTYGAGGTTRDRTIGIVKWIKQELGIEAMAHFTCVGKTVEELRSTLDEIRDAGIENVLALRGDPPQGQAEWVKTEGGLEYSTQLIELIGGGYEFAIGAACFPEVHMHAESAETDLRFTKEKQDSGARFLITQLFFDNEFYFDFVERAREAGITVPIIPGIMPVTNFAQVKRMSEMCGATFPEQFEAELEARKDDPDAVADLGVAYATLQCSDLLARGAPGIHFFTLNRSPATRAILAALRAARPWDRAVTLV